MTVPKRQPAEKRITPAEHLQAAQIAAAQHRSERLALHKRAREWAEERAKYQVSPDDPAFMHVMKRLAADKANGYRIAEPWCFKARTQIHLESFYEMTRRAEAIGSIVYYVKVGKYVKIGVTQNLRARMNSYPPDSKLLATEPGGVGREAERHEQFADALADRREWFTMTPELRRHIKNLNDDAARKVREARRGA